MIAGTERNAGSDRSIAGLRDALERAIATEGPGAARLGHAHSHVTFRDGEAACTLRLDRDNVEVVAGADGDITFDLSSEQARQMAAGKLALTSAVVGGAVAYEGPARRFLEVEPILRALLEQGATDTRGPGAASPAPIGAIAPELLAIETRDVHKSFGRAHILAGLDVQIPEGVISVVLGPSGTGKSVLLQHIVGLLRPDRGEVYIRGRALSEMRNRDLLGLRREIGVMFQDGALFSAMNVYDNVAFPLRQHTDFNEEEVDAVVSTHLTSVGLAGFAQRMPNELSGGMRKRAGLARALALNAGIILCDEPDSGLDPVRTALLGELLIEQHAQHGGTMVVVTHNIMLAKLLADHMTIVWRGKVLESGFAEHVLASETEFVQQFLAGRADGPLGMDA